MKDKLSFDALAQEIRRVDGSHSLGAGALADALMPFISAILDAEGNGDGGAVPIGWVFQHDETGRMTFCENDGVNNPENFAENNPRHALCGPAFTHPARSGMVSDEDVRDAERWRYLRREVISASWLINGGSLVKTLEDSCDPSAFDRAIDAAIQGERHER